MVIGLVSDTHGCLRDELLDHLRGVETILHAGDVGGIGIIQRLQDVAPVVGVWGNTDDGGLRRLLPEVAHVELQGRLFVVLHGHQLSHPVPAEFCAAYPEADVIVHGHTHVPCEERVSSQLVVNPGAAGPTRFGLRPSVATIRLGESREEFRLLEC